MSFAWIAASSFLVVGGFFVAVLPLGFSWIGSDLGIDALCFSGPFLGGLIAALASRRGRIGEVGLGALLAMAVSTAASLLILRSAAFDVLVDGGTLGRLLRSAALFCVGSMAGAGIGHALGKRVGDRAITAPAFWAAVGGTASLGAMFMVASVAVQLFSEPAILGLSVIIGGPSIGALVAQLMAPISRPRAIALGATAFPTAVMLVGQAGIGGAVVAFFMMWLTGWIGIKLAERISSRPEHLDAAVPEARIEARVES